MFVRMLQDVLSARAGDVIDETAVRAIRPGYGLPPKHLQVFLGKRVKCDVSRGTPLSWDHI